VKDSSTQHERTTEDGDKYIITVYNRNVEIDFNYYFTRARDGSLIGPVSRRGSNKDSSENRNDLKSASSLLMAVIDEQLRSLNHDIAPYRVTEQRSMMNEKSKDKILKARMKDALALTKEKNYRAALESYLRINAEYGNIASAVNASIMYEALGETNNAANLMRRVANETGNPSARDALARLNKILEDQDTLASEYGDTRGQTEKIASYAGGEIEKVLPTNARVWIYNNSINDPMAEAVADNLTSDFLRKGIGIVDRQSSNLIEAEQKFQLSGNVSDSDFVSIGNAVGANTIVTVGISGSGSMRRLQIRVLDIEKGVTIMQSDTSDNWRL
jgi:TolB-like protein